MSVMGVLFRNDCSHFLPTGDLGFCSFYFSYFFNLYPRREWKWWVGFLVGENCPAEELLCVSWKSWLVCSEVMNTDFYKSLLVWVNLFFLCIWHLALVPWAIYVIGWLQRNPGTELCFDNVTPFLWGSSSTVLEFDHSL